MIEAIIFDLGNVLIDFDHRSAAQRIARFSDKSSEEIFKLFFDSGLTALFEEGKISPQEFFLKTKEILNLRLDYEGFANIWNEIFFFTEKNIGVYNLAVSLKNRYKQAVLSNINILHYEYIKRTFPVLNNFQTIVTSFEAGCRKPHPAIYEKTLGILKSSGQNTFYTDDRAELVENAKNLGIRSFVFKGVEQLKNNLIESGIDIN